MALFNSCCHANGVYTQLEPRNLFHMHADGNNKRPDLLLINPPGFSNNRVVIDVSMTHCIPKSTTRAQAANFDKDSTASKSVEKEKIFFCLDCKLAGIGFHALIFESTGKPSNDLEKFLSKKMANSIEAKRNEARSNTAVLDDSYFCQHSNQYCERNTKQDNQHQLFTSKQDLPQRFLSRSNSFHQFH